MDLVLSLASNPWKTTIQDSTYLPTTVPSPHSSHWGQKDELKKKKKSHSPVLKIPGIQLWLGGKEVIMGQVIQKQSRAKSEKKVPVPRMAKTSAASRYVDQEEATRG